MNKINYCLVGGLTLLCFVCSCRQEPQFGKAPLHLDNFRLNLNVETFFADENLFRGRGKDYGLKAEEETIKIGDNEDSTLRYVQYSVTSREEKSKLARYNDFYFNDMEVVMDFNDKETFMVAASQDSVSPGKIDSLIKDISAEYGNRVKDRDVKDFKNITYLWKKDKSFAKLVLKVDNPFYQNRDSEQQQDRAKLLSDAYHKEKTISVNFYIASPKFDNFLRRASSISGLLIPYTEN